MISRLIRPLKSNSFFLFGARGTGKSTYIKSKFAGTTSLYIDLLNPDLEEKYLRAPREFERDIKSFRGRLEWVLVDEIQKAPKLLNLVHKLIEENKQVKFILTGSSARKLKRGSANLLAGRAFNYYMFPFCAEELGSRFQLDHALSFGSLPQLITLTSDEEKTKYLRTYVQNYLREEIKAEQLVRDLEPFRLFLEVAAQCSGKMLNFSSIAREVGSTVRSVQSYFQILEDTMVGFYLEPYHQSLRKSQLLSPKFYFFDCGVKRALDGTLQQIIVHKTSSYGELFEHWVIQECFRRNSYSETDYKMSFYATKNGSEIDLILSRGREKHFVEIKSSEKIDDLKVEKFKRTAQSLKGRSLYYISCDPRSVDLEGVKCRHWQDFLDELFPTR